MARLAWVVALPLLALPSVSWGHAFNPAHLELREVMGGGRVEVTWKTTPAPDGTSTLEPTLPPRCREPAPRRRETVGADMVERWSVDCGAQGLVGATVTVSGFRLYGEEAVVTVALADGRAFSAVLRDGAASYTVPARPSRAAVLRDYLRLGVLHILLGWDHLLFVLGLLLLVGLRRRLVVTLTAFTVAHSVTLSAAALDAWRLPPAPVEATIALSILLLAVELARPPGPTLTQRRPWAVAFAFGLLHGFGFAGALAEIGLPQGDVALGLLGFNLGVELGQLLFVAAAALWVTTRRWLVGRVPEARRVAEARLATVATYALGGLASYWCIERVAVFWR